MVQHLQLANGLQLLLLQDDSAPVVAYHTWFGVGSRHEQVGSTGIAHLFEHLMFKGTRDVPGTEFDRRLEEAGVSTNASTWLDWTCFTHDLPRDQLDLVARLEADRMANLVLTPEQVESEREVVRNERLLRVDNDPEGLLYERLYATLFPGHPYGHPTIGWMPDIEGITLKQCIEFYRRYYAPDNATVVIVGDLDPTEALKCLAARYGTLEPQGRPPGAGRLPAALKGELRQDLPLEITNDKVIAAWHMPRAASADIPAARALVDLLFGNDSARVHRVLVEERELATSVDAWIGAFKLSGVLEVQMDLHPGSEPEEALRILDDELNRIATEPPSDREMQGVRNRLIQSRTRSDIPVGSRAHRLGHFHTTVGDYRALFELRSAQDRITAEDVRRVAEVHLASGNRRLLFATPDGGSKEVTP
ncbi:MAG: pitrilysin family protein [Pseudomonadota bacterium]